MKIAEFSRKCFHFAVPWDEGIPQLVDWVAGVDYTDDEHRIDNDLSDANPQKKLSPLGRHYALGRDEQCDDAEFRYRASSNIEHETDQAPVHSLFDLFQLEIEDMVAESFAYGKHLKAVPDRRDHDRPGHE